MTGFSKRGESVHSSVARKQAQKQVRVEYLLKYIYNNIDKASQKGLFEYKETFKYEEAPSIVQADNLSLDLEQNGYTVTLDRVSNNRVKTIHIEWR